MDKIKILLVDDEKLIREGLKIILSTYEDIEVVGLCEDGEEAINICAEKAVDLILMDIRMGKCDGVLGTRIIKERFPNIKILMLTTFNDGEYISQALRYGASGYLLKDSSYELIYGGIKAALKGNVVVHPEVVSKMIFKDGENNEEKVVIKYGLNEKEINIIKGIAKGLNNKELGEELYLSEGTIKNNISAILCKLELRDRTQIAVFAFKNGIAN